MKTTPLSHRIIYSSLFAVALTVSPILYAEDMSNVAPPIDAQNSKSDDSVANRNNSQPGTQVATPDRSNSKDTTNSLDKNPSTADTQSAEKSTTKDPHATSELSSQPRQHSPSNKTPEKLTDEAFIQKAAQGGMLEVELGKLAEQKATSSDVKEFGAGMVKDHSTADAELKVIADKKGISVPTTLDAKHQASLTKFQHLSGKEFDKAYVNTMVTDHEKTASTFRQASTSAKDPEVKNFAGEKLKVIESHLTHIKTIQSSMK